MAPLEWLALFLAALVAVGGSAWLMQRRRAAPADPAAAARKRARRARDLGWVYDETVTGDTQFTLRGTEAGVKWKIRYHADATRPDERPTLTWATRSVQGGATELRVIGRARYERGKANFEPMVEKLSSLILSPRDIAAAQARAEFVERTAPAEVGTETFREKFTVLARNNRLARALFNGKIEASLAKWPGGAAEDRLSIWLDWQGLRIDVESPQPRMAEIEHLVAFGLAIAAKYRRHAASPGVTVFMEETQPGSV
ncbi:MAG TPA: hypothetical protein VLD36_17805 [Burkholderiales bacterium]|nr:hypothetical protein [Burkholderiales bacterium]